MTYVITFNSKSQVTGFFCPGNTLPEHHHAETHKFASEDELYDFIDSCNADAPVYGDDGFDPSPGYPQKS